MAGQTDGGPPGQTLANEANLLDHLGMSFLEIRTTQDADEYLARLEGAAGNALLWVSQQEARPLEILKAIKFRPIGFHPIEGHALNFVEQINQTWTHYVALLAARKLLELHPEAKGFRLAPGATASLALDVMSIVNGLVGAETFAAVHPRNNRKLDQDLSKLSRRTEMNRYVFFMSPAYPGTQRLQHLERDGVEVWSIDD